MGFFDNDGPSAKDDFFGGVNRDERNAIGRGMFDLSGERNQRIQDVTGCSPAGADLRAKAHDAGEVPSFLDRFSRG